jgi:hypothetical protein
MFRYYFSEYLSYSIIFACIIGAIRYKVIKSYHPFILFVFLSLFNEIFSALSIKLWKSNAINCNIYILLEYLILLFQFAKWDDLKIKTSLYKKLMWTGVIVWVIDNFILHSPLTTNSLFRIFYSCILVYVSIEEINSILFSRVSKNLLNAKFIICIGFIIYYSYKAVFEVFFLLKINFSNAFYINIFNILVVVNCFANLVYAVAIFFIPSKQKFTLPY